MTRGVLWDSSAILALLDPTNSWAGMFNLEEAITGLGSPAIAPLLTALVRGNLELTPAVRALGEWHEGAAIDRLVSQFNHEDAWIRTAVAEALGKVTDPALRPAIIPHLLKAFREEIEPSCAWAVLKATGAVVTRNEVEEVYWLFLEHPGALKGEGWHRGVYTVLRYLAPLLKAVAGDNWGAWRKRIARSI